MNTIRKQAIYLVDSEDYLAKLLRLKLKSLQVDILHVKPGDFDTEPPGGFKIASNRAVIISWPQPGNSPRKLLARIKEIFPDTPIIDLIPGDSELNGPRPFISGDGHTFSKPVTEPDRFFGLIEDVLAGRRLNDSVSQSA